MTEEATVTKKGQVTIPKKIRDKLGLKEGRKVSFEVRGGSRSSARSGKPPRIVAGTEGGNKLLRGRNSDHDKGLQGKVEPG